MILVRNEIRRMTSNDLASVMEIENVCFVAPWQAENILSEIQENPFSNQLVIEIEENGNTKIIGFAIFWITFDTATICQIAIHPSYQKNGYATLLMKEIIDECYVRRVRNITLEVRENNAKAKHLYEKYKFKALCIKPNYYSNGDNAIYMGREVNING